MAVKLVHLIFFAFLVSDTIKTYKLLPLLFTISTSSMEIKSNLAPNMLQILRRNSIFLPICPQMCADTFCTAHVFIDLRGFCTHFSRPRRILCRFLSASGGYLNRKNSQKSKLGRKKEPI